MILFCAKEWATDRSRIVKASDSRNTAFLRKAVALTAERFPSREDNVAGRL
jgi:hypothetical protein